MIIKITSDIHREFPEIGNLCHEYGLDKGDMLIITGDAGINYHGYIKDRALKASLSQVPITFLCVHGNHEMRPENWPYYKEKDWNGGVVYVEEDFPNLLFAKDGEVYDIAGQKTLVIGGAYSVDRHWRVLNGMPWFHDEMPSEKIKARVEAKLEQIQWKTDVVLTHAAPMKYEPKEAFLNEIPQSSVDKSTEKWLDVIEDRLEYQYWYCGHYHIDKKIDKLEILYRKIVDFPEKRR